MSHPISARRLTRAVALGAAILAVAGVLTSCTAPDNAADGEIVITCASCQEGEDQFLQYNYDAAQRFNEQFAGQYRIETIANQNAAAGPERLSYYQRLALADDLPDVFLISKQELIVLLDSAELFDFSAALDADDAWRDSYYEDSLASLAVGGGQYGIPEVRDVVGIYFNEDLLEAAGVSDFPATWDDFEDACSAIQQNGTTCFAMDGNWVTLLMWANLIATHPGGEVFLTDQIGENDWADDEAVVEATERLRDWHTKGYVNVDAFSGEYANAATVFQTGQAAMIANGPWMLADIKSDASAPGLADVVGYAPSPGWSADEQGIISITGGAWASGSVDPAKQQATAAFMKFLGSESETFQQTLATGSYPPVKTELTADQQAQLEPLVANLVAASAELPFKYPNVFENGAATFSQVWLNLWPAYVAGDFDTSEFLTRLTDDLAAG